MNMDLSVTIITSIAVALIYMFIIKPRRDKKAAEAKKKMESTNAPRVDMDHAAKQDVPSVKNEHEVNNKADVDSSVPDLAATNTVVWMAHCINLPFLPFEQNMKINNEFMSLLGGFEKAVKAGDKNKVNEIYKMFQDKMKEKFGLVSDIPKDVFKLCILSKDLLDVYKKHP